MAHNNNNNNNNHNVKILLKSRPEGWVSANNFQTVISPIPEPANNEVVVRNIYLSLDPAMRGWMTEAKSYIEPVKLGDVMRGATVGEVVASKHPKFAKGDVVLGMLGWQKYAVSDGKGLVKLPPNSMAALGLPDTPLSAMLGVLGGTGLTAYFGLLDVGKPKEGETVVVSAAAGATGSVVGQIAKIKGCKAVGIAGSDRKCKWLVEELGFDAAINYNHPNFYEELRKATPKGIDVFFDNVGGKILETVLRRINKGARVVICGAISQYNNDSKTPARGPENYLSLLVNRARMEGFIVFDYKSQFPQAIQELASWMAQKKLKFAEERVAGLENAPEALLRLFKGTNEGKLVVKIGEEPSLTSRL